MIAWQARRVAAIASILGGMLLDVAPSSGALLDPDSLTVTGYVQASYNIADKAPDRRIIGRLNGRAQDQFSLDAFVLGLERTVRANGHASGVFVRATFGPDATPLKAAGLDLGPQADLTQAYVTYETPVARGGLRLALGKMASLLGVEGLETPGNPNLSMGSQYIFVEDFTGTGLDARWAPSASWALRARVTNGWDVVEDPNRSRTVFVRADVTPPGSFSVALSGYSGNEQPGSGGRARQGGQLIAVHQHSGGSLQVQLDLGREPQADADWTGVGGWWTQRLREGAALALRGDLLDDRDGARTSGALGFPVHDGQQLGSLTATLNLNPTPAMLVRPELRWDHSDHAFFDGRHEQWTFALAASFVY